MLSAAASFAPRAHAVELDDPSWTHPLPAPPRAWYGWQTLLVDSALIAVFASKPAWPGFSGDGGVLVLDMLAFMAATPIIHAGHDDGMGGYSAALHIGGPLVGVCLGALIGLAFPSCSCSSNDLFCFCGISGVGVGAFAGTIAGMSIVALVDAFMLGWNPPLSVPDTPRTQPASWIFAPTTLRGGAALTVGRTF